MKLIRRLVDWAKLIIRKQSEQTTGGLGKAYNHVTSRADDEVYETEQYDYVGVAVDVVSACY